MDERDVVAEVRRVSLQELRVWVREGWVQPAQSERGPMFNEVDVARVRLLCDLRKEMALPTDVFPVVLTLIDRLHGTLRELRCLTEALEDQREGVRRAVVAAFHERRARSSDAIGDE